MGIKKTEGAKIKKEEHKRKASFHCPFIEAKTNIGALKHLRTCGHRRGPGNETRLQAYIHFVRFLNLKVNKLCYATDRGNIMAF